MTKEEVLEDIYCMEDIVALGNTQFTTNAVMSLLTGLAKKVASIETKEE